MSQLLPLIAAILPYALWPLELILPFPHLIEELAKAFLIRRFPSPKSQYLPYIAFGLLFSFSETVLYSFHYYQFGYYSHFFLRLFTTTPLHLTTSLVYAKFRHHPLPIFTFFLLVGIIFHYLYNTLLSLL